MWKKGSYDVSSCHQKHFKHLKVVLDNQRKPADIKFEKLQSVRCPLTSFSINGDKVIVLIITLFVIILALIGVIIWLSIIIHLMHQNVQQSVLLNLTNARHSTRDRPPIENHVNVSAIMDHVGICASNPGLVLFNFPHQTSLDPYESCVQLLKSIVNCLEKKHSFKESQIERMPTGSTTTLAGHLRQEVSEPSNQTSEYRPRPVNDKRSLPIGGLNTFSKQIGVKGGDEPRNATDIDDSSEEDISSEIITNSTIM